MWRAKSRFVRAATAEPRRAASPPAQNSNTSASLAASTTAGQNSSAMSLFEKPTLSKALCSDVVPVLLRPTPKTLRGRSRARKPVAT